MTLLNETTLRSIAAYSSDPPHAILLSGIADSYPACEAEELSTALAGEKGTVRWLRPGEDVTGISIEQVRGLYAQTRGIKRSNARDIWVIERAETMSLPAQNAFLKLLEEPPQATTFILAVSEQSGLLATISSRTQPLSAGRVDDAVALEWLARKNAGSDAVCKQIVFLSSGSASLLIRLVEDATYREKEFTLAAHAKQLISGTPYARIVLLQQLAAKREDAVRAVTIALGMLRLLLLRQPDDSALLVRLERLTLAHERIMHNGNVRAQLLPAIL